MYMKYVSNRAIFMRDCHVIFVWFIICQAKLVPKTFQTVNILFIIIYNIFVTREVFVYLPDYNLYIYLYIFRFSNNCIIVFINYNTSCFFLKFFYQYWNQQQFCPSIQHVRTFVLTHILASIVR